MIDLHIPASVTDHESFRCWARAECPEKVRIGFLAGALWLDRSPEELYSHNQVKGEVGAFLHGWARATEKGLYLTEGILLSNESAELSTMPDGMYCSYAAFRAGQVQGRGGSGGDFVEVEGSPEMVLEVVSNSSEGRDRFILPPLYWRAGIPEFWRIDARGAEVRFEILRREATGYVPVNEPDGWWRSAVFGCSFKLTQQPDARGQPVFTLEHRS